MIVSAESITYKEIVIIGNSSTVPVIQVLDKAEGISATRVTYSLRGNLNGLGDMPKISIEDPQYRGADGIEDTPYIK